MGQPANEIEANIVENKQSGRLDCVLEMGRWKQNTQDSSSVARYPLEADKFR